MAGALRCPVCPHGTVVTRGTTCPTCGADLAVLAKIVQIRDALAPVVGAPVVVPRTRRASWAVAAGVLAGMVIGAVAVSRFAAAPAALVPAVPANMTSPAASPRAAADDERTLDSLPLNAVAGIITARHDQQLLVTTIAPLFAPGSATLGVAPRNLLLHLAAVFHSSAVPLRIQVRGHTDPAAVSPSGPWASNWALGLRRAESVAKVLTEGWSQEQAAAALQVASAGAAPPEAELANAPGRTAVLIVSRR